MLQFLSLLLSLTAASTYEFSHLTININSVSVGAISTILPGDKCKKIIARNSHVYHTSSEKMHQSWPKGSLNSQTTLHTLSGASAVFQDFHVS